MVINQRILTGMPDQPFQGVSVNSTLGQSLGDEDTVLGEAFTRNGVKHQAV